MAEGFVNKNLQLKVNTHESLLSDITWAAEQVLRSADAFSSACKTTYR